MRQLETNLNFISSLPDDPTVTTAELKQEFDKAGNIIKEFINSILEADIATDIASCLASAKSYADEQIGTIDLDADNITYDNTTSGLLAENIQDAIDELNTNVTSASTSADEKIKYSDFDYSTSTITGTLTPRRN